MNWKIKKVDNSQGVVLGLVVGLLVIEYVFNLENTILNLIILGLGLISVFFTKAANVIAWIWLTIGVAIGKVNSTIILILVYYIVLTPIALLKKMVSPHSAFKRVESRSGFINRKHKYTSEDLKLPW